MSVWIHNLIPVPFQANQAGGLNLSHAEGGIVEAVGQINGDGAALALGHPRSHSGRTGAGRGPAAEWAGGWAPDTYVSNKINVCTPGRLGRAGSQRRGHRG